MSKIDRRALLAGVGVLAATGAALSALPTFASSGPSPEFREYLRCLEAHIAQCELEPQDVDFDSPAYEAWDAATSAACEARAEASYVIRDRPVRTERDFRELVRVVQEQLWQRLDDGSWDRHSCNDELEEALARALFQRLEGGVYA